MSSAPTILSVAFPFAPVGAAAVGGAEVLLTQLEVALSSFGFDSVVVAHASSTPTGQLYPVCVPEEEITDAVRSFTEAAVQQQIDRAFAENAIALVHMHGLDFAHYRLPASVPVLVTLHLPLSWYPETLWSLPANYTLICVSESQRNTCPEHVRDRLLVIENGVPLPAVTTLRDEGRYALMLARICPEKNLHTGLDAARLAGLPAVLAGDVFAYETHQRYFAEAIQPRLTHTGTSHSVRGQAATVQEGSTEARFLGPVHGAAKGRLLARAACLLVPSLAPETSSLVAMEALAAGVPVVAMASGAVPEIVEEGRTGFLVRPGAGPDAARAMAQAVARVPSLDRKQCRAVAAERFGLDRMLARYADVYRQLLRKAPEPAIVSLAPELAQQTPPANLAVEHITTKAALEALVPEWIALWQAIPTATPFQHPAWLLPWWEQFGPDGQLQTLALHTQPNGDLAAVLPLYTYAPPNEASRQLLFVGAGTTDYLDGLWSSSYAQAAHVALAYARDRLPDWDTAYLTQIRPGSPLLSAAQNQALSAVEAEPTALIDIRAELPAKLRANAGRYRRRAQSTGNLHFAVAASAEEALENFEHLVRFHRERWDRRGEAGVLSDPRVQAHHRAAVPALFEAGLLRFFRLTLNHEVLGVLYALNDPPQRLARRLYLYLIGFDTRHAALSPGTLLIHHVWQYARSVNLNTLDLLRGGEEYKQLWGARHEPTYAVTLHK